MCLHILDEVHGAERYLRESSGKVTGEVTIGLMPSVAASVLAPVLLQYSDRYPDVRLRVLEAYSGSLMEWLMTGTLDFAIVNKEARLSGVASMPLFNDSLVLVTGRQMLRRLNGAFPAKRLPELKLVLPSTRQGMRRLLDALLREADIAVEPQIELDSLGATLDLVRQSDWATILPIAAVQRAVAAKSVRALSIVEPQILREVVVIYNAQRPPNIAGKLIIELLQKHLEELLVAPAT
jgi:DNA-binding transcriptional LysR family regulator